MISQGWKWRRLPLAGAQAGSLPSICVLRATSVPFYRGRYDIVTRRRPARGASPGCSECSDAFRCGLPLVSHVPCLSAGFAPDLCDCLLQRSARPPGRALSAGIAPSRASRIEVRRRVAGVGYRAHRPRSEAMNPRCPYGPRMASPQCRLQPTYPRPATDFSRWPQRAIFCTSEYTRRGIWGPIRP